MLFESPQGKLMLLLAIPVIIVTQLRGFDVLRLLTQLTLFVALAYNADCLVMGNCKIWAWLALVFPLIMVTGFLFFKQPELNIPPPIRLPLITKDIE